MFSSCQKELLVQNRTRHTELFFSPKTVL